MGQGIGNEAGSMAVYLSSSMAVRQYEGIQDLPCRRVVHRCTPQPLCSPRSTCQRDRTSPAPRSPVCVGVLGRGWGGLIYDCKYTIVDA
jgi:hypothetical protein